MTEQISSLLRKVSLYEEPSNPSSTSSNQSESQNSKKLKQSTVDENYFHIKLRRLFNSPLESSFRNVEIDLNVFLQDVKQFLDWVKKQKQISEEESKKKMNEIKAKLQHVDKIKLDSFFINVPGITVRDFFNNMSSYSFPSIKENEISGAENYTILVESTHSIRSAIKKKPCQIHKYHLFFTVLNEYFKKDDEYFGKFQEFFFQKYFRKPIPAFNINQLSKEKNEKKDFPFSDNYVLIIASDNSFKIFKETIDKIDKSEPPHTIYKQGKKFPKIYEKGKNYENDEDGNEIIINSSQTFTPVKENYNYFNYIIKEVNKDSNWLCKIIYFDLYFNLIVPKCEITEGLTSLKNDNNSLKESIVALTNDNNRLNESIGALTNVNNSLKESISSLQKKNNFLETSMQTMENKLNTIYKFLNNKFSSNIMSELDGFMAQKK